MVVLKDVPLVFRINLKVLIVAVTYRQGSDECRDWSLFSHMQMDLPSLSLIVVSLQQ